MTKASIRPRERDALLQALRAGVVPRVGQHHIQVGRAEELKAVVKDLDRMTDGGSGVRFVIGDFGSGKTFFLNLLRSVAMEKRFVTIHADLAPDRRLHATGGQARSLYTELMRNMSTRSKPEGGALTAVVERFVSQARTEAASTNTPTDQVIRLRLNELSELVGGYDFAEVIAAYWRGYESGNEQLKSDAVRWLRGEFSTKTDARAALGVRTIVDDANVYDQLKLMALFTTMAGFSGLLVCLDEMVNLYKLSNTQARNSNYEQILRIVNDTLQGTASHLGFLFGGTPEFLTDTRRGLYSYEALRRRLPQNHYASGDLVDYSGPVLELASLDPEDFYMLLDRLRHVHAGGDPKNYLVPDEALEQFMHHCNQMLGDSYFRMPRATVTQFIRLLDVLEQNPGRTHWQTLIGNVNIIPEVNPDLAPLPEEPIAPVGHVTPASPTVPVSPISPLGRTGTEDDLTSFRL